MFKGIKLYIVIIVAVMLLAALLFGLDIYMKYSNNSLENSIKKIYGVKSVKIVKDKVSQKIYIGIKKNADLQSVYVDTQKEINKKSPQSEIVIKDVKGKDYKGLSVYFDDISYYIYESKINGDFPTMRNNIHDKLKSGGINYTIKVDENNIYVAMQKGDSALYKVVNYSKVLRGKA